MPSRNSADLLLPEGSLRRKIARACYLLLFDANEIKSRLRTFRRNLRHYGIRTAFKGFVFPESGPFPFPESDLAHRYCVGKGVEIGGSAHNPFGLNTLNVDYTDSVETSHKQEEIRLCGKALKVDIVAPGDDIPLPDESQDFVVSSHAIEHFTNPIRALIEWDRIVKPGGVLFLIVPHKERTFDKPRKVTPLSHVIEDYRNNNTRTHGFPRGHEHCWVTAGFVELIRHLIRNHRMKWKIVQVQDADDKVGNGFTVVIRKIASSNADG